MIAFSFTEDWCVKINSTCMLVKYTKICLDLQEYRLRKLVSSWTSATPDVFTDIALNLAFNGWALYTYQ